MKANSEMILNMVTVFINITTEIGMKVNGKMETKSEKVYDLFNFYFK